MIFMNISHYRLLFLNSSCLYNIIIFLSVACIILYNNTVTVKSVIWLKNFSSLAFRKNNFANFS